MTDTEFPTARVIWKARAISQDINDPGGIPEEIPLGGIKVDLIPSPKVIECTNGAGDPVTYRIKEWHLVTANNGELINYEDPTNGIEIVASDAFNGYLVSWKSIIEDPSGTLPPIIKKWLAPAGSIVDLTTVISVPNDPDPIIHYLQAVYDAREARDVTAALASQVRADHDEVQVWRDAASTALSTITADDTPAAPAEGESASYLVTSAVSWPAGLVWSTDPDGGVAPTITGTALVSLFTVGGTTRAIMGATFPAAAAPADTTAPTWTATFTMGTPTSSSVVATASALATDDSGSVTYEVSYNNAATWAAIVPSGSNFTLAGSPSTTYATTKLRAKDAAGNTSKPVLSVPSYTMAAGADLYPDATIYDTFAGMTDGTKLVTEAGGVYTSNRNTEKGGLPWVLTPIPLYSPLKPSWLPAVTSGRVQGGQSSVPRVGMLSCAQTKVKVEMDYGVGANYGDRISIGVAGSATQNITARITNLGELRIYRDNGTQLGATISGVATTGKIGLSYDPATGAITVWIDDVQTHSATTTTGLTGTVSHFEFQGIDGWFDNVRVTYL